MRQCFHSVFPLLVDEGQFIFDLNTRAGLLRWNNLNVEETEDALIITRGIYDGRGERAWMRVSGCVRVNREVYQRFDETVYDLAAVRQALLQVGWASVHFARLPDLATPLADPEQERRVFAVAHKSGRV